MKFKSSDFTGNHGTIHYQNKMIGTYWYQPSENLATATLGNGKRVSAKKVDLLMDKIKATFK